MECRSCYAEDFGSLLNGQYLSTERFARGFGPRNVEIASQIADATGRELSAVRRLPLLSIENAGDDIIRVMGSQTAKQRQGIFIGFWPLHLITLQLHIQLGDHATTPTQCEIGMVFLTFHFKNDFLEERAQQFLAIAIRGSGRIPHESQVGTESINFPTLFLA